MEGENRDDIVKLLEKNLEECRIVVKETLQGEMEEPLKRMDEYVKCLIEFSIEDIHRYQFAFFEEHASQLTTIINDSPKQSTLTSSHSEILELSKSTFHKKYWENFYDKVASIISCVGE